MRLCSGGGGAVALPHRGAGDLRPAAWSRPSVGTGEQWRCLTASVTSRPSRQEGGVPPCSGARDGNGQVVGARSAVVSPLSPRPPSERRRAGRAGGPPSGELSMVGSPNTHGGRWSANDHRMPTARGPAISSMRTRPSCSSPSTGKGSALPRRVITAVYGGSFASPAAVAVQTTASPARRHGGQQLSASLPAMPRREDVAWSGRVAVDGNAAVYACKPRRSREWRTPRGQAGARWTATRRDATRRDATRHDATQPWQSRAPSHESCGRG